MVHSLFGDLATHLRITTGFHHPFRLEGVPCPYCPTDAPVGTPAGPGRPGRGSGTGPLCHGAGVHDGLVVGGGERVVRGAVDDPTVRDLLAAVNDKVPANAVVMRPAISLEIPKDVGSSLILIPMQDSGGDVPG